MNILRTPKQAVAWLQKHVKTGVLSVDSRQLNKGDGFIAWPGAAVDGRQFVQSMLEKGISACLVEQENAQHWGWVHDERVAFYTGLKKEISLIAALYYGMPSENLDILAITGTNGKTSTSWWLAQALTLLGHDCGVIGTMGIGRLDKMRPSALTTPDPIRLHESMRLMADDGVKACAIEASSIGLAEHRFDHVYVKVALLTNVTQDHLDYHQTMDAYWQAKRCLFSWPNLQAAVINIDDPYGAELATELLAQKETLQVFTYTCSNVSMATLKALNLKHFAGGVTFDLQEGQKQVEVSSALIGGYNVSNMLGVIGALRALGHSLEDAACACQTLMPVPGRMQSVFSLNENAAKVVVDYAHTPDALENVLKALQPLATSKGGQLWCVFGCGGNRDASKRPIMGKIAQRQADHVIVTSDNPRHEDPTLIIEHILAGMQCNEYVHVEPDRKQGIAWALMHARPQDVVLIAGKGHESYQEVKGIRYPFSDANMASQLLNTFRQENKKNSKIMNTKMMTLQQAKDLLQAQGIAARLVGDGNVSFSRVHTDTRTLEQGDLFVALRGANFDAHDFLAQAKAQGACAVMAQYGLEQAGVQGLEVADSLKALGALASGWRACFSLPVIAVTGSNGKTTTTQMIASILHAWKGDAALATQGNLNNDIGVPLMLLRLRAEHEVAVFELGMNHPGEIQYLSGMTKPTVALINNAQREHLEFMDSVDAVAQENGQVIYSLPQDGIVVFPADDTYTSTWKEMAQGRTTLTFALKHQNDATYIANAQWQGDSWQVTIHTPHGDFVCELNCAGIHNVKNALAAAACAQQVGAPLEALAQGISDFAPVNGRSQVMLMKLGANKLTVVNDAYNANPDSVRAAIDVLAELPQPALLVLGEMGEVGTQGVQFHHEVGVYARERGVAALWGVGNLVKEAVNAFGHNGRFFEDVQALGQALPSQVEQYASVLIKGSRYMRMERVLQQLQTYANTLDGGKHAA